MKNRIIDFHSHPFRAPEENICSHKEFCAMDADSTRTLMDELGIGRIAGSVICGVYGTIPTWENFVKQNDTALWLRDYYKGFYIPGFHVHPLFVKESLREIERMAAEGVNLIGELVPYWHGWNDYACEGFSELLDAAEAHHMVVSFHSMEEDAMDAMVLRHPNTVFVAAHPGEYGEFMRHMKRMATSENYYLDVSGYGIFRHGMLRHALDLYGKERFLFGSDYPTCNPAMYLGGVELDPLLSREEKDAILFENAERLLNL